MTATIIIGLVMLVGLIGTVVPGIPGLILIWGGALAYGIVDDFDTFGIVAFAIITLLAILGTVASYVVPAKRASDTGAARSSIALGVGLAIVGAFVIPAFGLFIGGIGGIYIGERARGSVHDTAWRSTMATLIGFGIGALIEVTTAAVAIATWVIWVIFG